jgi:hypothetical protein
MVSSRRSSPVGGVDDSDVEVLDEQDDVGPGVGSAETDVAQAAGHAQGDGVGLADLVVADAVVGVTGPVEAGGGFGSVVGDGRSGPVGERAVRTSVVVLVAELLRSTWRSASVLGWMGWARSHFFMVCWNRSQALPQVVGWFGREFFCTMWRRLSSASKKFLPPWRPRPASRTV